MENELISVIITTYNRSSKVEDAIKSVINQTYKNLEIILVDDNCNNSYERDKTIEIAKKYENINLILNKKNLGGALSRNEGINNSNGNIISFLDDDDIYLPNRIEEMYKIYSENKDKKIGLVYCNCNKVDNNKNIFGSYENNFIGLPLYEQMMGCIAGTSMWLANKDALKSVGLFEDTPSKQDSILLLKLIANNFQVFPTNKKLVLYFEQSGKGISGTNKKNIEGIDNYRNWCRKYYGKLNSTHQINNVECNFSKQLITLYIINNMKDKAKTELKNLKQHSASLNDIAKAFFKIYLSNMYLRILNSNRSKQ